MIFYIPTIGDAIKLASQTTFNVINERRNENFLKSYLGSEAVNVSNSISLPKNTILKIDRIYIRQNNPLMDSITFVVIESKKKEIVKSRFFANLKDVNGIEFEMVITDKKTNVQKELTLEIEQITSEYSSLNNISKYQISKRTKDKLVIDHINKLPSKFKISLSVNIISALKDCLQVIEEIDVSFESGVDNDEKKALLNNLNEFINEIPEDLGIDFITLDAFEFKDQFVYYIDYDRNAFDIIRKAYILISKDAKLYKEMRSSIYISWLLDLVIPEYSSRVSFIHALENGSFFISHENFLKIKMDAILSRFDHSIFSGQTEYGSFKKAIQQLKK